MLARPETQSLRDALTSLTIVPTGPANEELRARVHDFVDMVKAEGWPIERVIVGLKQIASEAGIRGSGNVLRAGGTVIHQDTVLLDLVRWSVERYFGYSRSSGPTAQQP